MLYVAVDNITQDITKMWGANLGLLKQRITHELESSELAPDTLQRVIQCFDGTVLTLFPGLETLVISNKCTTERILTSLYVKHSM